VGCKLGADDGCIDGANEGIKLGRLDKESDGIDEVCHEEDDEGSSLKSLEGRLLTLGN
jgi:hypothetical protein